MTFGEKLQFLRKQSGLSQEQLAERLAVSRQAISKWELGSSLPDTENVIQLGRLFQVSLDYLLDDTIQAETAETAAAAAGGHCQKAAEAAGPALAKLGLAAAVDSASAAASGSAGADSVDAASPIAKNTDASAVGALSAGREAAAASFAPPERPAAKPGHRTETILGFFLTGLGFAGNLALFVLSTMIQVHVTRKMIHPDGGVTYYGGGDVLGYSFMAFIQEYRLQAIWLISLLALAAGIILLLRARKRKRPARQL